VSETLYNTLKFVHVLMAIVWVGGGIAMQIQAVRAQKAGTAKLIGFAKDVEWIGTRVFVPASLILLIMGIWLVWGSPLWAWNTTWVLIGIIGFLTSFVIGATFLGPESGRLGKIVEEKGPDDPESARRIRRIFLVSRIDLVILVVVVWAMVTKPGT